MVGACEDLPYGVIHPGHGEVGCQVGRVGGADHKGKEPPAAHDDAQSHGACRRVAPWRGRRELAMGLRGTWETPSPAHRAAPSPEPLPFPRLQLLIS